MYLFAYLLFRQMQGTHPRDHRGGICIAALEVRIFFGMTHNTASWIQYLLFSFNIYFLSK